jgi:hypothetical protein
MAAARQIREALIKLMGDKDINIGSAPVRGDPINPPYSKDIPTHEIANQRLRDARQQAQEVQPDDPLTPFTAAEHKVETAGMAPSPGKAHLTRTESLGDPSRLPGAKQAEPPMDDSISRMDDPRIGTENERELLERLVPAGDEVRNPGAVQTVGQQQVRLYTDEVIRAIKEGREINAGPLPKLLNRESPFFNPVARQEFDNIVRETRESIGSRGTLADDIDEIPF